MASIKAKLIWIRTKKEIFEAKVNANNLYAFPKPGFDKYYCQYKTKRAYLDRGPYWRYRNRQSMRHFNNELWRDMQWPRYT